MGSPVAIIKAQVKPKLLNEATEKSNEKSKIEGVAGGGSPTGAVLFSNKKDPPVVLQEGDPPIGKERGALGVGTGPPPPQANATRASSTAGYMGRSAKKLHPRDCSGQDQPPTDQPSQGPGGVITPQTRTRQSSLYGYLCRNPKRRFLPGTEVLQALHHPPLLDHQPEHTPVVPTPSVPPPSLPVTTVEASPTSPALPPCTESRPTAQKTSSKEAGTTPPPPPSSPPSQTSTINSHTLGPSPSLKLIIHHQQVSNPEEIIPRRASDITSPGTPPLTTPPPPPRPPSTRPSSSPPPPPPTSFTVPVQTLQSQNCCHNHHGIALTDPPTPPIPSIMGSSSSSSTSPPSPHPPTVPVQPLQSRDCRHHHHSTTSERRIPVKEIRKSRLQSPPPHTKLHRCTTVHPTEPRTPPSPPPPPTLPCTAPAQQPSRCTRLNDTEGKTYVRIQSPRNCRDSTIKEVALVSKIPPTETTPLYQPKPPNCEQKRAKLKSKSENEAVTQQQQTKQLGEENKQTTTNTSENKTTGTTRVSRIADMFKTKQQEHELKQMKQTTINNKKKPSIAEENKNNKKPRQTTQETPKVKKTITKTKTPAGKQNNKNTQKLQQTLKDMWKNENLTKIEKQENQQTTENQPSTTTENTTNKTTNERGEQETKPATKDLKQKQVAKTRTTRGTKQITDIQQLKLFLAKKKQERAQNGILKNIVASSSTQPLTSIQSSAHSSRYDGDRTSQTKPGEKNIAAKGENFSAGNSDWLESTTRPGSNQ